MAEVFVALRRELDGSTKPVVIKRPLPELAAQAEFLNMFTDEARIASVLDHPNVAKVHEIVQQPGGCLLVLELVDGRALSALMVRGERIGRRMDARMSAYIIARAAEGLHYAHGCQDSEGKPLHIVHRDVSPQNILISFSGEVKVIDFGIAQALGRVTRTKTGARKGKSGYMAPEQVKGLDLDARVDVFGLGIVLWELLCARRLFVRPDEYRIMNALLVDPVPRPSEYAAVPPELERIVMKALSRDRASGTTTPRSCAASWTPSWPGRAACTRASWETPSPPSSRARARCSSPRWREPPASAAAKSGPHFRPCRRWRRCRAWCSSAGSCCLRPAPWGPWGWGPSSPRSPAASASVRRRPWPRHRPGRTSSSNGSSRAGPPAAPARRGRGSRGRAPRRDPDPPPPRPHAPRQAPLTPEGCPALSTASPPAWPFPTPLRSAAGTGSGTASPSGPAE